MVDPIGPIKMKSRTEWLLGTQAAPNYRGVAAPTIGVELRSRHGRTTMHRIDNGADGIDVLYHLRRRFQRARRAILRVVANLRKAKFLVVHSWDANHPLNDVADVLLPSTIHAEKEGTFTNLQGRVQRISSGLSAERTGRRPTSRSLPPHRSDALPRRRSFAASITSPASSCR